MLFKFDRFAVGYFWEPFEEESLFAHNHFGVADDFTAQAVALLQDVNNFTFSLLRRRGNFGHGLVLIGVELVAGFSFQGTQAFGSKGMR